jgi:hypothetical protein
LSFHKGVECFSSHAFHVLEKRYSCYSLQPSKIFSFFGFIKIIKWKRWKKKKEKKNFDQWSEKSKYHIWQLLTLKKLYNYHESNMRTQIHSTQDHCTNEMKSRYQMPDSARHIVWQRLCVPHTHTPFPTSTLFSSWPYLQWARHCDPNSKNFVELKQYSTAVHQHTLHCLGTEPLVCCILCPIHNDWSTWNLTFTGDMPLGDKLSLSRTIKHILQSIKHWVFRFSVEEESKKTSACVSCLTALSLYCLSEGHVIPGRQFFWLFPILKPTTKIAFHPCFFLGVL